MSEWMQEVLMILHDDEEEGENHAPAIRLCPKEMLRDFHRRMPMSASSFEHHKPEEAGVEKPLGETEGWWLR